MASTQNTSRRLPTLTAEILGDSYLDFLQQLGGPAWFTLAGRDTSRRRVIVTLLHGNEPSGLKAVHALLSEEMVPATDLGILVAGADAAVCEPLLTHRYIPGERDLNRCFKPPRDSNQGELAEAILDLIYGYAPEAVEFGGFMDPNADRLARETLHRFISSHQLTSTNVDAINLLIHPIRLESEGHLTVTYASSIDAAADLTMINTIDQLNFRPIEPGTLLGWFNEKKTHQSLIATDRFGTNRYVDCFDQADGLLRARVPMTLFMATTDPVVASADCLLYFTAEL